MSQAAEPDAPQSYASALGPAFLGPGVSLVSAGLLAVVRLRFPHEERLSFASVFGVLSSISLAWLLTSKKLSPREKSVACLATLGWLPILFVLLALTRQPLVQLSEYLNEGPGFAELASPVLIAPCLIAGGLLAALFRTPRFDRMLWVAAIGSLVGIAGATAVALCWVTRPDPDTYLSSLPVVQTLAVGDSLTLRDGTKVTYQRTQRTVVPKRPEPGTQPAFQVYDRDTTRVTCELSGVELVSQPQVESQPRGTGCGTLRMRYDATSDVWVIEALPAGNTTPPPGFTGHLWAFTGRSKRAQSLWVADVAKSIAPPLGWTLGGLVGVVFQFVALRRARALARQSAVLQGVDGSLQPDGHIVVPGHPPVEVPGGRARVPGPAWVRFRPSEAASYREAPAATLEDWGPGTLAQARAALTSRALALVALSLAAGWLCAAPLILTGLAGAR
jgi:hypothetical protein